MLSKAIICAIAYFICYAGNYFWAQNMCDRPIVAGLVAGLLLGDVHTGLVMGATLEAVFMGAVNIGGNISAEPCAATVFAVYMATQSSVDADTALALAVPISMLSAFLFTLMNNVLCNFQAPWVDRLCDKNDTKGLYRLFWGTWFFRFFVPVMVFFFGMLAGSEAIEAFVNNIPVVILNGISAAGKLLPAVGISILMKMVWQKELAGYFFLGFVLFKYLGLPHVAIVVIAVVILIPICLRDKQLLDLEKKTMNMAVAPSAINEEEDFLS